MYQMKSVLYQSNVDIVTAGHDEMQMEMPRKYHD